MSTLSLFAFGCIGAAAPEIVRLYRLRTRLIWDWKQQPQYVIISLAFFALGGTIAVLLPTITPWGAFYAGASTPVIISRIGTDPPGGGEGEPDLPDHVDGHVQTLQARNATKTMAKVRLRQFLGLI